ncbi:MAG TPA: hypothetical protein VF297_12325, partial [Pyrinomonadaceae bacterium]
MKGTPVKRNNLTHQGTNERPHSPWRFAARLAVVVCAWLCVSAAALGQNVQFTQGSVGSGRDNSLRIPIASYPG